MIGLFNFFAASDPACTLKNPGFLGFPTWYQYLPGRNELTNSATGARACTPTITGIGDVWLVAAAAVEIILRFAAIAAVFMIIYGGIQLVTAQGEPDKATQARKTITNALIGLIISIVAATVVTFIAGAFS